MDRKFYTLLLLTTFFLSNCNILQQKADRENLGDSAWKLIAIKQNRENLGQAAILKFDEKDGEIKGVAACNSFKGEFEKIRNLITFGDLVTTKMYCEGKMDEEILILSSLKNVSHFEVKSNMLYLYSKDELLLTYKR